ncbi:MAG: VOC family protein [Acidobacteriaceae bacterium]|nr:VOC family protein [Acidobacteriaceae bacterium]
MALTIQGMAPLLQVFDMPASICFYRDQLGFAVTQTSPPLSGNPDDVNWAMLQLADATVMLNTAYEPEHRPEKPQPGRFGGHDDTCLYFGCPDVDAAYEFLCEKGLRIAPPKVAHYGMKQLYVKDPDGYMLCFQWTAKSA